VLEFFLNKKRRILMKKMMSLFIFIFGIILGGCSTVQLLDRRIIVSDDIASDVHIVDVRCRKTNSNYNTIQANVKNLTSAELPLQWKVVWFDINGIEIDSITSTWNDYAIQPGDIIALKHTAPSLDAIDARIYIRQMND
jgi:uncharacterized protein YcfL